MQQKRRSWTIDACLATVLATVVFAASWRVTRFGWVLFDDDVNILLNPHLACNPAKTAAWAFTNLDYIRRYLPLGWLQFDVLLALGGYNAAVFHVASCVLHAANAALAWWVFRTIIRQSPNASSAACTKREPVREIRIGAAAAVAAALWSLHPLRAENVGWISGLLYLGSTTLALLALLLYFATDDAPDRGKHYGCSVAATLLYASSLLVYPVFLVLPVLLTFRGGVQASSFARGALAEARRLAGWWAAAVAVGAINLYARVAAAGAFAPPADLVHYSAVARIAATTGVVLHYVVTTLWPGKTSPYYGHTRQLLAQPGMLPLAGGAVLTLALSLLARKTRRATAIAVAGGLITLAPVLIQVDGSFSVADRYAVLWLAYWAVLAGCWLAKPRSPRATTLCAMAATGALALCAVGFVHALGTWRNTATLQAAIDCATAGFPDAKMSYSRPATAWWTLGRREDAARLLAAGLQRFPSSSEIKTASELIESSDRQIAARLGEAGKDVPPLAIMHVDLGRQWLRLGDPHPARAHFAAALALAPNYTEAKDGYRQTLR